MVDHFSGKALYMGFYYEFGTVWIHQFEACEAFRQVDYTLENSERGTPPPHRGSWVPSSCELSERICMNPIFSVQKK